MDTALLSDIEIIFIISIAVLFLCQRLRVPSIVGFLLAGILIGPSGLGFVSDVHQVETLAEIGVILLLFTIGMEFSLARLVKIKKEVLLGGAFQVVLTVAAGAFVALQFDIPAKKAIFVGFLLALSSTAIVLKTFQEKAEVDSPHGRISLGILIFQDIIIVPMMLLTPLLAGTAGSPGLSLLILLAKGACIILLVIVAAKWVVPYVLYQIAKTRSHELFLLSVIVICFGVAWSTAAVGLSLALGAFLAGLIISETEYSHAALGNILPFRSVFTTFFFISIGMMLDLDFLFSQPVFIALITLCVLVLKTLVAGSAAMILGYPLRTGVLVGCALCQLGEFSFILSRVGMEHHLFSANANQMLLAVAIISMALTPLIIKGAPSLAEGLFRLPLLKKSIVERGPATVVIEEQRHLVIIGFGLIGGNVARAAKAASIPYVVIEMNPDTVRREQKKGEPIYYGDATHEPVLEHVRIGSAKVVLVAINDPTATRGIVENVKRLNPHVHLIVRTRYIQEMKDLYKMGADEVIPEEFETSVEIFARILAKYLIPRDEIDKLVGEIRADGYEMFRHLSETKSSLSDLDLEINDVEVTTLRLAQGSPVAGKTLSDIALRKRHGVSVVAIRRNSKLLPNPGAETALNEDDVLYLLGSKDQIATTISLFSASIERRA